LLLSAYVVLLQRSAAVVYDSAEGVSAAMKQGSSGQLVQFELPLPEGPVGLKAWVAAHKAARPGNEELQKQVCCAAMRCAVLFECL
jgi:hypothetical protein